LSADCFLSAIDRVSESLAYVPPECYFDVPACVVVFLQLIITLIDEGRIVLCERHLEDSIERLSGSCEQQSNIQNQPPVPSQPIMEFLGHSVQTVTPGICYVIAYASESVRSILASQLAMRLSRLPEGSWPWSALPFIARSIRYAVDQRDALAHIAFHFSESDSVFALPFAKTVRSLAIVVPDVFVREPAYVPVLITILNNSLPPDIARPFLSALFAVVPRLGLSDAEVREILTNYGNRLISYIPGSISQFFELKNAVEFLSSIIKNTRKVGQSELTSSFYVEVFRTIEPAFKNVWYWDDKQAQDSFTGLIQEAIKSGWIVDLSPVLHWVCDIIKICPVGGHFHLMSDLIGMSETPIPQIVELLNGFKHFSSEGF
jgi:hypothetical protein